MLPKATNRGAIRWTDLYHRPEMIFDDGHRQFACMTTTRVGCIKEFLHSRTIWIRKSQCTDRAPASSSFPRFRLSQLAMLALRSVLARNTSIGVAKRSFAALKTGDKIPINFMKGKSIGASFLQHLFGRTQRACTHSHTIDFFYNYCLNRGPGSRCEGLEGLPRVGEDSAGK